MRLVRPMGLATGVHGFWSLPVSDHGPSAVVIGGKAILRMQTGQEVTRLQKRIFRADLINRIDVA